MRYLFVLVVFLTFVACAPKKTVQSGTSGEPASSSVRQPVKGSESGECEDVICTEVFVQLFVQFSKADGTIPVIEKPVLRSESGRVTELELQDDGSAVLLDDSAMEFMKNRKETFTLIAYYRGKPEIKEEFIIKGDCCHVQLVAGEKLIIVD